MTLRKGIVLSLLIMASLLLCLCSQSHEMTWALRTPQSFPRDFMVHQELVIRRGEQEISIQTVLQRRGETLTLIGLTPLGTRAFVIVQRGEDVELTLSTPTENVSFDPTLVLSDIQRTLLPLLGESRRSDGEHRDDLGEEVMIERWRDGRLRERRFRARSSGGADGIDITYHGEGYDFDEGPGMIELRNDPMGYTLELRTLSYQDL